MKTIFFEKNWPTNKDEALQVYLEKISQKYENKNLSLNRLRSNTSKKNLTLFERIKIFFHEK